MRTLIGATFSFILLAIGIAEAQERKDEAATPKGKTAGTAKPLQFDVEGFFKDFDKNKDGYLERDELPPAYRSAFGHIDKNKDGKISREELTEGIAFLHPRRRPSDLVYMLIEMSDYDDDCHKEVQRAYQVLRSLDKNKDGKIDESEIKEGRERIVANRVKFLFDQLDVDKDGKISREEAKGRIRENFNEIDRNRDGFIERDELLKAATERPSISGPAAVVPPTGERRTTPPPRPPSR
jgi:Ca2+-binding EF-hand superfamily protein